LRLIRNADWAENNMRKPWSVPAFTKNNDGLFILAVMHLRREPNYWAHRTADTEGDGK